MNTKQNSHSLVDYKTEVVPLTSSLAKRYDEMPKIKGERDPKSKRGMRRVRALLDAIVGGRFHSPVFCDVVIMDEHGTMYRVNGGGSSRALCMAAEEGIFPKGGTAIVRHFRVETMAKAMKLYQQLDYPLGTRTSQDIDGTYQALIPSLDGVNPVLASRAAKGMRCHLRLRDPSYEIDYRELFGQEPELIMWAAKYCGSSLFKKQPIIAAMCATWCHHPTKAEEFWQSVSGEEGVKSQPIRMLYRFLSQVEATGSKESKFSPRKIYTKILRAWNSWRDGGTTSMHYYPDGPLPKLK